MAQAAAIRADVVPGRDRRAAARRQDLDRHRRHARQDHDDLAARPHPTRRRPRPVRCLVGGVPVGLGRMDWRLGNGPAFVIEGDEYDTAFFDKGPKFAHYRPNAVVLTSVELDHVDIFPSFDAVRDTFKKLVALIPPTGLLVAFAESSADVRRDRARPCAATSNNTACSAATRRCVRRGHPRCSAALDQLVGEEPSRSRKIRSRRVRRDYHEGDRFERFETLPARRVATTSSNCARGDRGRASRQGVLIKA